MCIYVYTYVLVQHKLDQHGNLLLNTSLRSNGLYLMLHEVFLLHLACTQMYVRIHMYEHRMLKFLLH